MSLVTFERNVSETDTVSFDSMRLRESTLQALTRMGIETPTPIQAEALPALLDGRDVIGQARTGSGKTLAFGIPAAELVDTNRREVQVLVLTPTRELAVQVGGVLDQVGGPRGVKTTLIFGGRALGPQRDALRRGVHVVVGTPGRVLDLLNQGVLWLDQVRFLVLDEADEMLDRGFAPDVERIISRTANSRQTALFSATVPDWVKQTAARHLNSPVHVSVDPNPEDAAPIEHVAYDVHSGDKMAALCDLLDHRGEGAMIVFGRTKHGVKKLARQLERDGYPVSALQGNLSQNARDQVMADFRSGRVRILLATNVAARGIDVTDIEQVINYELPESPELLTHRVGRTGRMGRKGQAITLLGPDDGAKWRQLERGLGRRIPRVAWRGAAAAIAGLDAGGAEALAEAPARPPSTTSRRERAAAEQKDRRSRQAERPAAPSRDRRPARSRPTTVGVWSAGGRGDEWQPDDTVSEGENLAASHGRDPRRPAWAGQNGRSGGSSGSGRVSHGGSRRRSGAPAERRQHQIVCDDCGREAHVPFRPDPARPVYCADCFRPRGDRGRRAAAASHVS